MDIRNAYTLWSTTYDSNRNLTRDLDYLVTRDVLSQAAYSVILETGCGTGKNTPFLAEIGQYVYALDFSEGMITQARAKTACDNVQFAIADLDQAWPCGSASVDLICCNLVLEHVEDLEAVFKEAWRVLRPQGQFFISELHPFWQYDGKQANFDHDGQTIEVTAFMHHLSDFTQGARRAGFQLGQFNEWWHEQDEGRPPRLVSFLFEKP